MSFTMTTAEIAALHALLQIIATPEAAKKRLDEIVEQTKKLEAAEQQLMGTQSIGAIRAELAERENMLNIRLAAEETNNAAHKAQRDAINAAIRTPTA
jgi:hypothetical protein